MKIVHVVESLAVGGLERVVLSLASWQRGRGDTSLIVCLFHEGELAVEARKLGIEVVATGKTNGPDLRALLRLRAVLRAYGADVLHTHNAVAHYYAIAATVGLGIARVVNTRHGMNWANASRQLDFLYRLAIPRTHAIASVCRAVSDRFVSENLIPDSKAFVVLNGVSFFDLHARNANAKKQLLTQLSCAGSPFVIGTVGRLSAVKDHATLLKAVHRLRGEGRDVHLVVVGDGNQRPFLEALRLELELSDNVHFLGMRQDVGHLLAAFDVFALPSISEGYSLALVEAAAAELPIVATQVGGNADIVAEGTTGLLIPAQNTEALVRGLARMIDSPEMRDRMGRAGRLWALEHGTVEAMGLAYLALYKGVMAAGDQPNQPPTSPTRKT